MYVYIHTYKQTYIYTHKVSSEMCRPRQTEIVNIIKLPENSRLSVKYSNITLFYY